MADDKFIGIVAGIETEIIPLTTSTGAADANRIMRTGADGRLDISLMALNLTADCVTANAFETLAAGAFCYSRADGTIANASGAVGGHSATGFVLAGATAGQAATLFFEGRNTALTGITIDAIYFLSDTTPGGVTLVAPSTTGKICQRLGTGVTATSINTQIAHRGYIRA